MDGDKARAKIFAERAYAARVIIEGDDSPAVAKLKALVERHSQHQFQPKGDGLELEDWLWRKNEWSK
jgi:hypothetical protein